MPITEVTYQNAVESIQAAYNPIVFRCKAVIPNATPENYRPQMVFCDIYINSVYYKSLWKSNPYKDENMQPEYEFDIQEALQEVLTYNLPKLNQSQIKIFDNTIKTVFVRFRNSVIEDGFTKSEQLEPIQGTSNQEPVSGGGTQSNSFYVINAGIQPTEPHNLGTLLNLHKTGQWHANVYPLTKRPKKYNLCKDDSSYFPLISDTQPAQICLKIYDDVGGYQMICSDIKECPMLQNLSYSVEKSGESTQKFVFTWDLPVNYEITEELVIHYKTHDSESWTQTIVSIYSPAEMILPLGKYDFKFDLQGACNTQEFDDLPQLLNIGIVEDNAPTVSIYWMKSHDKNPINCISGGCLNYIEIEELTIHQGVLDHAMWQHSTNGGTTWSDLSLMTDTTIPVQPADEGEHRYRLKALDTLGGIGYSNELIINVTTSSGNPIFSDVTDMPNTCPEAGRVKEFTIEGDENQIVKVHIEVLDTYGHGAFFTVFGDSNQVIFVKSISVNGQTFTEYLDLGSTGIKTFKGELCLQPCAHNNTGAGTSINMTLYNNDNETLSDQYINWSATMDCL